MTTLAAKRPKTKAPSRAAKSVRFADGKLCVLLEDGREIGIPIAQFPWLARATATQRRHWHIEPRGFAIYWDDLDDGIEVEHLFG
jgi:hypothetical protein